MFSNPFTPESKKAKKSLFGLSKKMALHGLNSLAKEKISQLEKVDFHGIKVLKSEMEFLDMWESWWQDCKPQNASEEDMIKFVKSTINNKENFHINIKINLLGQIEELKFNKYLLGLGLVYWFPIETLKHLKKLSLDENNFKIVPEELLKMAWLKELSMKNNYLPQSEKDKLKKVFPFAEV